MAAMNCRGSQRLQGQAKVWNVYDTTQASRLTDEVQPSFGPFTREAAMSFMAAHPYPDALYAADWPLNKLGNAIQGTPGCSIIRGGVTPDG